MRSDSAPPTAQGQTIARLASVTKRYGDRVALGDFSLHINAGEVLAVLGPNGAGKTTALSILTGLRVADEGQAILFDGDPRTPSVRRQIGVTPQDLGFPPMLTVREILDFVRCHYENPYDTDELLRLFELSHLSSRATGGLSIGERRRLAIAVAFAGRPRIVFLDEPTTGLDVEARRAVWSALRAYVHAGGTIFLTTHYLEEAAVLASRVVIVAHGRGVFDGSVGEMRAVTGVKRVHLEADRLPPLESATVTAHEGRRFTLNTRDADALVRELVKHEINFRGIEVEPVSVEEAFLSLTTEPS